MAMVNEIFERLEKIREERGGWDKSQEQNYRHTSIAPWVDHIQTQISKIPSIACHHA
jgi:hypothetical protein